MIYADTSVIVALLTPEASSDAVVAWLTELTATPVASDWLLTEFASAISIKVRTGQLTASQAEAVHAAFASLAVDGGLRVVPVTRSAFQAAADMVRAHRTTLRAGDALHLAVAREVGAETIATLDTVMARNAKRLKMGVVEF